MLTITQTGETAWVIERDGTALSFGDVSEFGRYEDAVAVLAAMVTEAAAAGATGDGLLPEPWRSPDGQGVAYARATGDGRDFSECAWTWRDPSTEYVPLMLQTSTDFGHFGAVLAGFAETLTLDGDRVQASGRFYDSDAGRQFRDMLLSRPFTVSVDPGAVTYEDECLSVDDDGWCEAWMTHFLTYQIIGITGTPFAGFSEACIELGAPEAVAASGAHACGCDDAAACSCDRPAPELSTRAPARTAPRRTPVTAAAVAVATRPPRMFFEDPQFLMPTPLTISDQGHVMAHLALRGTCHVGNPVQCVTAPETDDFRDFTCGGVLTEEGDRVETGALTWGIPHADLSLDMISAQAHYALSTAGWADVATGWDRFGIWVSGALRPGVTDDDVRILRALSLSGDWRYSRRQGSLAMCAGLAVNYPGFPIIASGGRSIETARQRARTVDGEPMALVASGVVRPGGYDPDSSAVLRRLAQVEEMLSRDARARLARVARDVALDRLRG